MVNGVLAPHVIYHETNFNSTLTNYMYNGGFTGNTFDDVQLESVGGTAIELNGGNFEGNVVHQFQAGMGTKDISSESNAYTILHTTGTCSGNTFNNSDFATIAGANGWGSTAWMYCGAYGAAGIGDDWGDMTVTVNYGNIPVLAGGNPSNAEQWEDRGWRDASGNTESGLQLIKSAQSYDSSGTTLARGTLVTEGQYGGAQVSRITNAATQDIVGVMVGVSAPFGGSALVAYRGPAALSHETSTSTTGIAGQRVYVSSATPSTATVSTTASDQAGPEIGTFARLQRFGNCKRHQRQLVGSLTHTRRHNVQRYFGVFCCKFAV